jgi:hypothetical protein
LIIFMNVILDCQIKFTNISHSIHGNWMSVP